MTTLARAGGSSPIGRVFEHRFLQYRRTFRATIFSSFLNPVLFLLAMGVGLGTYVDQSGSATQAIGGLSYLQFLAPGLLAATAMQSAAFESTFPIMAGLNWQKVFHAMHATPISAADIVVGDVEGRLHPDPASILAPVALPRHRAVETTLAHVVQDQSEMLPVFGVHLIEGLRPDEILGLVAEQRTDGRRDVAAHGVEGRPHHHV